MTEDRQDGPALHLVPATDPGAPDPDEMPETPAAAEPDPDQAPHDADTDQVSVEAPRDPLLARAERIADLPLAERPAAFDGLNRAVVAELNTLEEG